MHQGWKQKDREALRAWRRGDPNGLIKAYTSDIRKLAERFGRDSRRNRKDKLVDLSQHARHEEGRLKAEALARDGLRKDIEVADPDELFQVGCEALLDAAKRYDEKRGTRLMAFAYKRIDGAMRDHLAPRRGVEHAAHDDSEEVSFSVIADQVALFLKTFQKLGDEWLDGWREFIQNAPFERVRFFWWFLYQYADQLDPKVGRAKREQMLGVVTRRHFYLRFKAAADSGAKFVEASGPSKMEVIERRRRAKGLLPAKLDAKKMGGELGVDGKTIARWRKRIAIAGTPPLIEEDGSFTLKSQKDFDAFNKYFIPIHDPRAGRRLQRRRLEESE